MHFIKNFANPRTVTIGGRSPVAGTSGTAVKNLNVLDNLLNYGSFALTTVSVSSSSATDNNSTGARVVKVFGLDANFMPQTENLVLTGQTAKVGLLTFSRVFAMEVVVAGTGKANAGDLYAYTTGTALTSGVPTALTTTWVKVLAGEGAGENGLYTVPANRYAVVDRWSMANRNQIAEISIWAEAPEASILEKVCRMTLPAIGPVCETAFVDGYTFSPKTDIYLRVTAATSLAMATAYMQLKLITA